MAEIILHHYDRSPFSEKVRAAFGIKGLSWRSVRIPDVMPKPDYTPLTGGYRRTPSMQIGADIYCDSAMILLELERRFPEPTLFPTGDRGLGRGPRDHGTPARGGPALRCGQDEGRRAGDA